MAELSRLNHDLLSQILALVDGPALAAVSSVSSELHGVSREENLWQRISLDTWPSTREEGARSLISSSGGFARFYGDSFPLIAYRPMEEDPDLLPSDDDDEPETHLSPSDLVSFVDVYYENKCVFSKVLYGIPGAVNQDKYSSWFSCCPFRIDLLQHRNSRNANDNYDGYDDDDDDDRYDDALDEEDDETGMFPSVHFGDKKERGGGKLCKKLEKKMRLSWVLLNKRSGRAVNLSSWRPLTVQRHWPAEGDISMRFGCVVATPAECVISVKCRLLDKESCLKWRAISLRMEDRDGRHLNGGRSLSFLERALSCCSRSRKWLEFERGYGEYTREKKKVKEKKLRNEGMVDGMCVFAGIAMFSGLCYLGHSMVMC
ncbi:probable F-box protein At2g36090 [Aristolochia californica]|uniref:probable F-box protein At2g36090 n=1 Tax=Aristolochia californica TaxID=171875 RepID=UPI0035DECB8F